MRRTGFSAIGWTGVLLLTAVGTAQAEYRPAPRREPADSRDDSFRDAVDLKRFRKGNDVWDTQALVASGLTALHEEHVQILRELEALRVEIKQLKERRK